MVRSPSPRRVLAYQVGLSVVAAAVCSVMLWCPQPWCWVVAGTAVGLMVISTVLRPPAGVLLAGAVALLLGGTYLWHLLFATQVELPPAPAAGMGLALVLSAGLVPASLRRSVAGVLEAERIMRANFERLASVDPETDLDCGWRFVAGAEAAFRRAQRHSETFAVLLLRIMYLEQFRRVYGEREAKHLVRTVADALRRWTRLSDQKFRLDFDTFALVLPNTSEAGAAALMTKLEQALSPHPLLEGGSRVNLTLFFGYAGSQQGFTDHLELIGHAEDELVHYVP